MQVSSTTNATVYHQGQASVARHMEANNQNLTHATLGNEHKAGSSAFQQGNERIDQDGNRIKAEAMNQTKQNYTQFGQHIQGMISTLDIGS